MTTEVDLREGSAEVLHGRLFEVLEQSEAGDELRLIADRDPDPELVRYQLEHDRVVEWERGDPSADIKELWLTVGGPLTEDSQPLVDVRDIPPQRRHAALLEIFDDLSAGEGILLVNDHDPKPLYHELRSLHGDVVEWEYVSRGSGEWKVDVGKSADSSPAATDVLTRFDVREIPESERHSTIHHRYEMIPNGGVLEIIASHEPRLLHQEFLQRYGDSFAWAVVESKSDRCRVRITKNEHNGQDRPSQLFGGTEESDAPDANESLNITSELDVRELQPAERHQVIFDNYAELNPGEAFVLVNDHDPKPLYYQFDAEAGTEFRWQYRQRAPGEFRVIIGKSGSASGDTSQTESS